MRPNNSNSNRTTRSRTGADARYRSRETKPPVTRQPADVRAAPRPRKDARPISQRYRPSDVVRAGSARPSDARPNSVRPGNVRPNTVRPGNRRPAGPSGRLTPRSAPLNSGAIALDRSLAPNVGSPRLGAPAGYASVGARANGTFVGRGWAAVGYRGSPACGVWGGGWGWNNNWCCNTWGVGIGWGGGWGYSPFGYGWASRWSLCGWGWAGGCCNPWAWNVGVLAPYYAWHNNYWNGCYRSAYWTGWSVPNTLPSNYWWYPTTTYCPTYLYVPSSTVVIDEETLEPVYGGGSEVIVAGSDVVGSARAGDSPSTTPTERTEAVKLAEKYVELGDFYFQAKRYNDAAEAYAKARNYLPNDASVHFVLADAVFANGDYHYAAFLIAEAVRLEPGIVTAETDKRTFYTDPTEFESQIEALQRYCGEKPYDAWAQLLLGYNLRFSDRPARAIVAFRRVLELDRDNPTARAFLEHLEKPSGAAKSGR